MADSILDIAKAGQVDQNALSNVGTGVSQGVQLAAAYQNHQNAMQDHANNMQQFQQKQSDWFASKMNNVAGIIDPTLRQAEMKRTMALAQQANIPVDPNIVTLIKNDEHAKTIRQGYAALNNIPLNDRTSAALDFMQSAGDAGAFESKLHSMGEQFTARQQFEVQRQVNQMKFTNEQTNDRQSAESKAKEGAYTRNKDNAEQLKYANNIIRAANDPAQRTDAVSSAETTANMLKTMFPQGTIKEGEVKYGQEITAGVKNDIQAWLQNKEGKGKITEPMWKMLGHFAQRRADSGYENIQRDKIGDAKYLQARNINPDDVYSFAEKPEQYGAQDQQATAQAGAPAQGQPAAQAPAQTTQATPQQAQPQEAPQVHQYAQMSPKIQAGLQKIAQQLKVNLDPASPDFSKGWLAVQQYLAQHPANASMTAQQRTGK